MKKQQLLSVITFYTSSTYSVICNFMLYSKSQRKSDFVEKQDLIQSGRVPVESFFLFVSFESVSDGGSGKGNDSDSH